MRRTHDSVFAALHPAVCLAFFAAALLFAVLIRHPAYLAVSVFSAAACCFTLRGAAALRTLCALLPVFAVLSALNPLFNPRGERVLFRLLGRPYTLEALYYGMAVAGMFVTVMLWFSCWNAVMTGDKLTSLFGSLVPALSLLLVMVLRLIPAFQRKARQFSAARRCVGLDGAGKREAVRAGMATLSALTSWALEGSVVTADSMRARGYGTGKRTSFQLYRFCRRDQIFLTVIAVLTAGVTAAACLGWAGTEYTPALAVAPVSGPAWLALAAYAALLLIPTLLYLWEGLTWHCLKFKI